MRSRSDELSMRVTLSGAKDLAQAKLVTLRKQRDSKSLGEVPHSVRDDTRLAHIAHFL
jgi:hypothetical protein